MKIDVDFNFDLDNKVFDYWHYEIEKHIESEFSPHILVTQERIDEFFESGKIDDFDCGEEITDHITEIIEALLNEYHVPVSILSDLFDLVDLDDFVSSATDDFIAYATDKVNDTKNEQQLDLFESVSKDDTEFDESVDINESDEIDELFQ